MITYQIRIDGESWESQEHEEKKLTKHISLQFSSMLTEFALLTALTMNADEREAFRGEIINWVKFFLPKISRESTRTAKCRLIASSVLKNSEI